MIKTFIAISIACLALASCHRDPMCSNTVTVIDGNGSLLECSEPTTEQNVSAAGKESVTVALSKSSPGAAAGYTLSLYAVMGAQFVLDMHSAYATALGPGAYQLLPQDSANNTYTDFIKGQAYKISGGTVTITRAASSNVSGTFTLNVFNASGQRTITGTINANKPYINY